MLDKTSLFARYMPKLTDAHINPSPFQTMSCHLAFQVLSQTVAATLRTYMQKQKITDEDSEDTANFNKLCNNLLDILNSKGNFPKH